MKSNRFRRKLVFINGLKIALLAGFLLFAPNAGMAQTTAPFYIEKTIGKSEYRGTGILQIFIFKVYTISRFVHDKDKYALVLQFNRDVDRTTLIDYMKETITALGLKDKKKIDRWMKIFGDSMPKEYHDGHEIAFATTNNATIQFFDRGKQVLTLNDDELVRYFFGMWLDPKTPLKKIYKKLTTDSTDSKNSTALLD